ncbi:MAG: hypothetical protein JNK87_07035, partial [Bryobacterales bacterium]|nr:hypothetical protein [Bryobacterales bacterium]
MLFLISILIALLPAQIEYRATSSQATVSTPAASHACVLQASLSADMQDALTAAFDAEAARYHLDNLQPGQRYFVQLLCDGKLADAATLTTEPDTSPVPAPQRPCDTAPREITASGEGAVLSLPVNPDCGKSLARQASWLRFHPHASDARLEVDPNPGAARQTSVYIGSEEVLVRQAAGTNCLFNLGSSWFPGNSASYSLTVPA